jgi:hypothetical protein
MGEKNQGDNMARVAEGSLRVGELRQAGWTLWRAGNKMGETFARSVCEKTDQVRIFVIVSMCGSAKDQVAPTNQIATKIWRVI